MTMDNAYNFEPRTLNDRHFHSYRQGTDKRHTKVAVSDNFGRDVGTQLEQQIGEMLLYMKAMVAGLSLLTDTDLMEQATIFE